MSLDCETPRGMVAISAQQALIARCAAAWRVTTAGTTKDAALDVAFLRDGRIVAVAEVKNRRMTLAGLRTFGSYLITWRKLVEGRRVSRILRVPFLLIVGLEGGDVWWTVTDAEGEWVEHPTVKWTETQATVNGGLATRRNAYLSLEHMQIMQIMEHAL